MSESYFEKAQAHKTTQQYATRIKRGDVGKYALLPGDPYRVGMIKEHLDSPVEVAYNREFRTVTGHYKGIKITAMSTGVGCPSAALAVEELANCGTTHFIRVGSTAAFHQDIRPGDIVISRGVMRFDGLSRSYVPDNFPVVPDHFLTHSLLETAWEHSNKQDDGDGYKVHFGINSCADFFYSQTLEWIEEMTNLGLTNAEMESSAIFTVAQRRGLHAAMICGCSYNFNRQDVEYDAGELGNKRLVNAWDNAIAISLDTIVRYENDKFRKQWAGAADTKPLSSNGNDSG